MYGALKENALLWPPLYASNRKRRVRNAEGWWAHSEPKCRQPWRRELFADPLERLPNPSLKGQRGRLLRESGGISGSNVSFFSCVRQQDTVRSMRGSGSGTTAGAAVTWNQHLALVRSFATRHRVALRAISSRPPVNARARPRSHKLPKQPEVEVEITDERHHGSIP